MKTDNELIAEFMGELIHISKDGIYTAKNTLSGYEYFKYDSSYDWLIPVIERICEKDSAMSRQTIRAVKANLFNINIVYEAVIEFIKWYNENNIKN